MPIRRLREEVNSRDFTEYMAYDRLQPFGMERLDAQNALAISTNISVHTGKHFPLEKFMVAPEEYDDSETPTGRKIPNNEELGMKLKHVFGLFGKAKK